MKARLSRHPQPSGVADETRIKTFPTDPSVVCFRDVSRRHRPCPANDRHAGFARGDHDDNRKATSAALSKIRWGDQGGGFRIEAVVAAARRATKGCAQCAAHYDG